MTRTAALLVLAPLAVLAACDQAEEATPISINAQTDEGTQTVARMDADGRVTIDTPVLKANLKLPKMAVDASELDLDGMKLFPGSKVTGVAVEGDGPGDKGSVRIAFEAPAGAPAVRGWFVEEAKRAGYNVQPDGGALVGTTADGSGVRLEFAAAGAGTRGTVRITER